MRKNLLNINFKDLTQQERKAFAQAYKFNDLSEEKKIEIRNFHAHEDNLYQIRKLLSLPMNKRTNFLRKRINDGSAL